MSDRDTIHSLSITLGFDDTALTRLLGVVRRRGFSVRTLQANDNGAGSMAVSMDVESPRPIDVLVRQIARIIDVESVSIQQPVTVAAVAVA